MANNSFPGTSLLHIHVTAETTIDIERLPSSSINRNFPRLQLYFSETVTSNIVDMIKQATCFGRFNHYQTLFENIEKILDPASMSLTFNALDKGLIMA